MKSNYAKKDTFLNHALLSADWFVNSQLSFKHPWQADQNRFLYYYYLPEKKYVPGINWTHGRAIFVLTQAYAITKDAKYLESAELGARYLKALQPLNPDEEITYGSFREEIPQAPRGGVLDGAQAASGMLMLYQMTGNKEYLKRGRAFCQFLLRTHCPINGMPGKAFYYPERIDYQFEHQTIHRASALPLWHLHQITGEGDGVPILLKAADDVLLSQREDGAITHMAEYDESISPEFNHHWGLGEGKDKYILRNDDGLVYIVLAAYRLTKNVKYLDAMVNYANWIKDNEPNERPFCAFGLQASNLFDIGKEANIDYSDWIFDHLEEQCLSLQILNSGDKMADGGFCGEDEEGDSGIFGGHAKDYITTRNTCYMAGLLFRLSGKGTGSGFSVDGLKAQY